MQLPIALLDSLQGIKGFDREGFESVHTGNEQITSIRINPRKPESHLFNDSVNIAGNIPWSSTGYYLSGRPSFTFDPLFHAGCYYVQEASSMFLEQAIVQHTDLSKPLRVLDLCASPGGKSTHLQSILSSDSLLVSNEVIRSRVNVLRDNIIKWGGDNVAVTNNDPKDFSGLEQYFDIIVVDAPCSGSGLFRRDPAAIAEWSENNVQLCSQRQQRILADVLPALKAGGLLIYSTCSYSAEEDEVICQWLQANYPLTVKKMLISPDWGIIESGEGYRFWPDKVKGEGFYLACFQNNMEGNGVQLTQKNKQVHLPQKEIQLLEKWIRPSLHHLVKYEQTIYAWPEPLKHDLYWLANKLRVIYSGVKLGEIMRDKLVPDHALALSSLVAETVPKVSLCFDDAIKFLQRKEFTPGEIPKGWQLAAFSGHTLGWMNVLPNRINNYYPKELRILKEFPSA
ncbi:MAG TPA: Fmu (Sun) domain protein [Chitinophagaceae bacterium]|nr:Fmu (Sun) domain protein [Chitinophagaceae bacterium]